MKTVLFIFMIAFFAVSVFALGMSLYNCGDRYLSKSCRSSSWTSFGIGLILLYLRFVLT